jgi:hypothetical protein
MNMAAYWLAASALTALRLFAEAKWDPSVMNSYAPDAVADQEIIFRGLNHTVQVLSVFDGGIVMSGYARPSQACAAHSRAHCLVVYL